MVDLIDLRTVGEPWLGQILKHGQRIIGSDADHAELVRRHVFDAEDFPPCVDRMLRERRWAWAGGSWSAGKIHRGVAWLGRLQAAWFRRHRPHANARLTDPVVRLLLDRDGKRANLARRQKQESQSP